MRNRSILGRSGGFLASACCAALLAATGAAQAGVVPYAAPGVENATQYSFTASATGNLMAYFYASDAAYDQTIGVTVNGVSTGVTGLLNHSSSFGDMINLGHVNIGDALVFTLQVLSTGNVFHSQKSLNADGFNHVYSTDFGGGGIIPAGVYVGFEDIFGGGDRDYNDMEFVFKVAAGVPEPSTWAMMLIGFAGLGFAARRRGKAVAAAA
ncbi:MAG: PEPxxWA-CTERM sorting domain-containing protein [Rhizobiales bacterium]|nr:PEPxxWA-CTERM sorting domain-containing protein [Hyphomicrobiales bacterium]